MIILILAVDATDLVNILLDMDELLDLLFIGDMLWNSLENTISARYTMRAARENVLFLW